MEMKIFSKEAKIAVTAIITLGILYAGIIYLKGTNFFNNVETYYVEMQDVTGVDKGSDVLARGIKVGKINNLVYRNDSRDCVLELALNPDFEIPVGSTAYVTKEMLGTPKVVITLSNNADHITPGDTIRGEESADLMASAADMVPQITALIPKIDSILTSLSALVADPSLAATLHNLEYTTNNLRTTTDGLNKMLNKDMPKLMNHANTMCANLETFTTELNAVDINGIATNANQMLSGLNTMTTTLNTSMSSKDNTLGMLLNDNTIALKLDTTVTNAALLLEDLRLHPKRYVHFSLFGKKDK